MASAKTQAGDYEQVYLSERGSWRGWLEKNHATSRGIWLVFYRKAAQKPSLEYEESVEEALCFGWVDNRTRRLDDERYMLMFTPRRPTSPWSRPNKERVKRLVASGKMASAGMVKIGEAKRNGAWIVYDPIEDLVVPDDLAAALAKEPSARENFENLRVSAQKNALWWIASARRPQTRAQRVAKTAAAAAQNKSPL